MIVHCWDEIGGEWTTLQLPTCDENSTPEDILAASDKELDLEPGLWTLEGASCTQGINGEEGDLIISLRDNRGHAAKIVVFYCSR